MATEIKFSRHWGMAASDTFDCEPIKGFVQKYLLKSKISVDPFARNKRWATHTNDLNPATAAQHHLEANEFLKKLVAEKIIADLIIFDPPYSRRQIMECYEGIGQKFLQKDSQYHSLNWKNEREKIDKILIGGGIVFHSAGTQTECSKAEITKSWR